MLFVMLYAVYCSLILPGLFVYIDLQTDCLSGVSYLLAILRVLVLLIPGVAPIVAYIVYKNEKKKYRRLKND